MSGTWSGYCLHCLSCSCTAACPSCNQAHKLRHPQTWPPTCQSNHSNIRDVTPQLTKLAVGKARQVMNPLSLSASSLLPDLPCREQSQLATGITSVGDQLTLQAESSGFFSPHSQSATPSGLFNVSGRDSDSESGLQGCYAAIQKVKDIVLSIRTSSST